MRPLLLDTCAVLRLANGEFKKFSKGAMKALREADILYVRQTAVSGIMESR